MISEFEKLMNEKTIFNDYDTAYKAGQIAHLQNGERPDFRYSANQGCIWDKGRREQSEITCKGIEIESGVFSGCTQTGGDCPECGK